MDRIQRNGETWHRQPSGEWLRFDVASGQWLAAGSPPPPPPPPPADVASPYVPLEKPARRGISLDGLRASLAGLDRRIALIGGAALLAVLLLAGGVVAFGGNDGGIDLAAAAAAPVPEAKKLSKKQQFIHDADALCVDVMKAMQSLGTPTTLEEVEAGLKQVRAIVGEAIERGQAIKAPRDARRGWKNFVGDKGDLEVIDDMTAALLSGDMATVQSIEADINKRGARERRWAKRYGMKVCSQELS